MNQLVRICSAFALTALAFALTSCSVPVTPEALAKRGLKPGEGLIVGSFKLSAFDQNGPTTEGTANSAVLIGKAVKGGGSFVVSPRRFVYGEKEVFAIPVKAGDYEFVGWSISAVSYPYSTSVRNRQPMKVPFRVNAGEAVYVGRVNAAVFSGNNLFGLPALGGGLMLVTDHFQEDAGWIQRDFPVVSREKIRRSQVPNLFMEDMKRIGGTPPSFWRDLLPKLNL